MKTSHEQFQIQRPISCFSTPKETRSNMNIQSSIDENSNSKIKLNCFLTDSFSEINFEVDRKITLGTLKKKIIEKAHLNDNKKFSIFYNDKDFTNFNKLRLLDIIDSENEDNHMSHTEPSGFGAIKLKIVPNDLNESMVSTDSKFKQMLECNLHPHENAHFYCLNCDISFCALCIEKHTSHDFLDKYDFSKSKQEIAKTIIRNLFALIQEKKKKESLNIISEKVLNPNNKNNFLNSFKGNDIIENIKLIWANYENFSNEYKENIFHMIDKKVSDFNSNLFKFKRICINNLSDAQKATDDSDIITLDNDYFQGFHQTLKDLNIGRDALMNYLEVRNNECDCIVKEGIKFDEEILNDLKNILNKIQSKKIEFDELYNQPEQQENLENNIENNNNNNDESANTKMDTNFDINDNQNINNNFNINDNLNINDNINNNLNINDNNLNINNKIFENGYYIGRNNNGMDGVYNSMDVSMLSVVEEGNIKNEYTEKQQEQIKPSIGAGANEYEVFTNNEHNIDNNNNLNNNNNENNVNDNNDNNFLLDQPNNTLINGQNNNMNNLFTMNNNFNDTKNSKIQNNNLTGSCGTGLDIDEYGEGGNSLKTKMNKINSKNITQTQMEQMNSHSTNENKITETQSNSNSNYSNRSNSKNINKYIMKRKLLKEIYIYNIKTNRLESVKNFSRDANVFKRFLQFSIYLNAKNNLYITGGKTKDDKISNSFYCYNYENNSLTSLPNMLSPRCSHSMIYLNNNIINDELFIIGGHNNNTGERYSFSKKKWDLIPSLHSKERQVPTLISINEYLYMIFGFVNGKKDPYILGEKLNLSKMEKWEGINAFINVDEAKMNKFNVGLIRLSNEVFLLLGGEINTGGETDDVYKLEFQNKGEKMIITETKLKLPCCASFIDKNFIEFDYLKFAQFDMKKTNFIFYDACEHKFGVSNVKQKKQ